MAISYVIDVTHRIVFTTFVGEVSTAQFHEHAKRLRGDPDFDPDFCELQDLRHFSSTDATPVSLCSLAASADPFSRKARRAAVAPSDFAFGVARMYCSLHQGIFAVFRTISEANQWLGVRNGERSGH